MSGIRMSWTLDLDLAEARRANQLYCHQNHYVTTTLVARRIIARETLAVIKTADGSALSGT